MRPRLARWLAAAGIEVTAEVGEGWEGGAFLSLEARLDNVERAGDDRRDQPAQAPAIADECSIVRRGTRAAASVSSECGTATGRSKAFRDRRRCFRRWQCAKMGGRGLSRADCDRRLLMLLNRATGECRRSSRSVLVVSIFRGGCVRSQCHRLRCRECANGRVIPLVVGIVAFA